MKQQELATISSPSFVIKKTTKTKPVESTSHTDFSKTGPRLAMKSLRIVTIKRSNFSLLLKLQSN